MNIIVSFSVKRNLAKILDVNYYRFKQIYIKNLQNLPVQASSLRHCSNENVQEEKSKENLIYKGELKYHIVAVKILSLTSSMVGLAIQPALMYKMLESNIFVAVGFGIFSIFFIVCTPLLFHILTKRYVLQLTFNPETKSFAATTLTLFMKKKVTIFTAEDVTIPEAGLITTFIAKKQPMFVNSSQIIDLKAFKHLMGYDKPMDFQLGTSDEQKTQK